MPRFKAKAPAKMASLCGLFLCAALTAGQTQVRPAASTPVSAAPVLTGPVVVGPLAAPRPALVPFSFRQPNGAVMTIKLRRLPAFGVVRNNASVAGAATTAFPLLPSGLAAKAAPRFRPLALGGPRPAVTGPTELFNSRLDYSHDNSADIGWLFPTRGYDQRNRPTAFPLSLSSLIYPTDAPYLAADKKTMESYDNFGAKIELIQLGQAAQISSMQISMGVAREEQANYAPFLNLNPPGGIAVILFWDGVYNDLNNGFPRDNTGAYRLAQDGTGANGVLVQLGQGFNDYALDFDNDGSGIQGRFRITDPKGRMGLTIAAVHDPSVKDADGNPLTTRQDGVYVRPGASTGQNKYFLISDGNFNVGTTTYQDYGDGNLVATTQNTFGFVSGDNNGDIFGTTVTQDVDGSVAYQVAPADLNFNPGESKTITVNGQTGTVAAYAPLNTALTLYGTKLNGTHAALGELRGRIRLLGVEPDNTFNPTLLTSPYDPTPATPSLSKVPGESKVNRFRFTFISPQISDADTNHYTLWNPLAQLPTKYTVFQQEVYALPSYGDNSDYAAGGAAHGTTLKYNYRLRGIPAGTYSVIAQAIPITDIVTGTGGSAVIATDFLTPYNMFPGSDFAVYYAPKVVISESLFNPPGGDLSKLNYDNYTNTTSLDIKLHRLSDVTGGIGKAPDGLVDSSDFTELIGEYNDAFSVAGSELFDIGGGVNGIPDGSVDSSDFTLLIGTYGMGLPEIYGY